MPERTSPLDLRIDDLDFSRKVLTILRNEQIHTVGELVERSEGDLLRFKCMGTTQTWEIREVLRRLGLALRGESPHMPTRESPGVLDWFSQFASDPKGHLTWPVWLLDLCPLTEAWLERRKVESITDLLAQSEDDLRRLGPIEDSSPDEIHGHLDEIRTRLGAFGLTLQEESDGDS